jgi:hypothetical protein
MNTPRTIVTIQPKVLTMTIQPQDPTTTTELKDNALIDNIWKAVSQDPEVTPILNQPCHPGPPQASDQATNLNGFTQENNTLLTNSLIYVPNNDSIKLQILQVYQNSPLVGH